MYFSPWLRPYIERPAFDLKGERNEHYVMRLGVFGLHCFMYFFSLIVSTFFVCMKSINGYASAILAGFPYASKITVITVCDLLRDF